MKRSYLVNPGDFRWTEPPRTKRSDLMNGRER